MRITNQYVYTPHENKYVSNAVLKKSGKNFKTDMQIQNAKAENTNNATISNNSCLLRLNSLFKHTNGISVDLEAEISDAKEAFRSEFQKVLNDNGIQLSQPIDLQSDLNGNLYVSNDSPDKEKIEAVLKNNPDLVNEFHHAEACADLLAHVKEAVPFQQAYAKSPQEAVAQYMYLFSQNYQDIFIMHIEEGQDKSLHAKLSLQIQRR